MAYLIYINNQSVPVLVEVPERLDNRYAGTADESTLERHYKIALDEALSDESKHIQIKNAHDCFNLKESNGDYVIQGINDFNHHIGETFPIPEGVSVSFEHGCSECGRWLYDVCRKKNCSEFPNTRLAILSESVGIAPEAKKEDGTNIIKILEELNQGIAEKSGMRKLVIYKFQAKQIEDTFRMFNNFYHCHKKESSADRDFMQSWQMIKNVLSGKINEHVPRI